MEYVTYFDCSTACRLPGHWCRGKDRIQPDDVRALRKYSDDKRESRIRRAPVMLCVSDPLLDGCSADWRSPWATPNAAQLETLNNN